VHFSTIIESNIILKRKTALLTFDLSYTVINYINHCITSVQTLLKRSPHFHILSTDAQRLLINDDIYLRSWLNTVFIDRKIDIRSNSDFGMSSNALDLILL
jgi:hypothetical protein